MRAIVISQKLSKHFIHGDDVTLAASGSSVYIKGVNCIAYLCNKGEYELYHAPTSGIADVPILGEECSVHVVGNSTVVASLSL